jgi:hypothetical protein
MNNGHDLRLRVAALQREARRPQGGGYRGNVNEATNA